MAHKIEFRCGFQEHLDVIRATIHPARPIRDQSPGFKMVGMKIYDGMDAPAFQHFGDGRT